MTAISFIVLQQVQGRRHIKIGCVLHSMEGEDEKKIRPEVPRSVLCHAERKGGKPRMLEGAYRRGFWHVKVQASNNKFPELWVS